MDSAAFGFDVQRGDGPRSLTSAVLERLRGDILSTKLVPGQKLHIAGLAKQFSVSLAAVREALSRLVADGLVQASDQRGFRVSPVSPADLEDVTRTRIDIEGLALRRSIERGDQAWLNSVESSFAALCAVPQRDPGDPMKHNEVWIARHRIFHRALVNACGSHWLLGFRDVLHEQSERYRRLSIRETGKSRDVAAEHAAVVHAVLRRDADAAVAALTTHFLTTMQFVELAAPRISEVPTTV
ncbi:transcriptional regulator, GntR family [Bradyrhizobium erythrophlei]|jgi:DNA-binding GntR family transcriptional regulator|uniref:Transcriptional regulator, GntR family n=1 Tax=Bradyrhizobium erythrophlei TaxID=1437360 RepID=A0A1M5M3I2_9BRAD|nr:transcriptional regulator, GntR family [Bradyrhizobium erythrophlei]